MQTILVHKKDIVDNFPQINIYKLQPEGLFHNYPKFIELSWLRSYYKINIEYTSCFYGGKRPWFLCKACKRRAGILYKLSNLLCCRKCGNLAYISNNRSKSLRSDPLFKKMNNYIKANELIDKTKRFTYRGKPTKNSQKSASFYSQSFFLT